MLATRLENQKLTASALRRPEQVVRWLGAVQAQDYAGAKWALALRAPQVTDRDVEEAFGAGRILRTHVLRPTWHFVTPEDIRWMLALTGPRVRRLNLAYARKLGIDEALIARARRSIERSLEGGRACTRAELTATLRQARIDVSGQPLAHLLLDLEQQAILCSGPRRGKQFTYALLEERAPNGRALDRDQALAELTSRYFRSHGPATLRDFAWWSGLSMTEARRGADLAEVAPLAAPPNPQRVSGADYLLPNYDEYVIAYRDRTAIVDTHRTRNLGVFTSQEYPHYLLLNGRIAGSWRRTLTARALAVDVRPYERLSRRHLEALGAQARRYGRFLGISPEVRIA